MLELTKFLAGDLWLIDHADEDYPSSELAESLETRGEGLTGWTQEGIPVISAGIIKLWDGVGEAWAFVNREWSAQHPVYLHRLVKRHMLEMRSRMGLIRMQAYVRYGTHSRWTKALGLNHEATLAQYFPGSEDAALYSWLKGN